MKLFDCTTYYDEEMILDLRFNMLDQYVDKFIVCEAKFTHSGRKKELIGNSGGDNIAPTRPEGSLIFQDTIFQAMVEGDRRPYLVAIIVPEKEKVSNLTDQEINTLISEEVKKANESLSSIEKIRKFIVILDPFSTDNGLLTPTMKVRRHKVKEIYGEALNDLYGSKIK